MATYKIHPAIGIARVGNSTVDGEGGYLISPEKLAGLPIDPATDEEISDSSKLRDNSSTRGMKRQAARFRVYQHDDNGEITEMNSEENPDVVIRWRVRLANKKASWFEFQTLRGSDGTHIDQPLRNPSFTGAEERETLVIDPGTQMVEGPNQDLQKFSIPGGFRPPLYSGDASEIAIDTLGGILTDEKGHLLVLGGHGRSGTGTLPPTITNYANNNDWFDDTSDGPVTAEISVDGGTNFIAVEGAWVIVPPPSYVPEIPNLVSLYDTIFDMAVREKGYRPDIYSDGAFQSTYHPNYERDVKPIFDRTLLYNWVVNLPFKHGLLNNPEENKDFIFFSIRNPNEDQFNETDLMPDLAGDNALSDDFGKPRQDYLAVTKTQYFFLQQWYDGNVEKGSPEQPVDALQLDRVVLENCVGGAFSPGIEMTWISREEAIYEKTGVSFDFRIKHKGAIDAPLSPPPTSDTFVDDFASGLEAGDITKFMAIPWQADFDLCTAQDSGGRWWWPPQRPVTVFRNGEQRPWYIRSELRMVDDWKDLGFVINQNPGGSPDFQEVERILTGIQRVANLYRHRH